MSSLSTSFQVQQDNVQELAVITTQFSGVTLTFSFDCIYTVFIFVLRYNIRPKVYF